MSEQLSAPGMSKKTGRSGERVSKKRGGDVPFPLCVLKMTAYYASEVNI